MKDKKAVIFYFLMTLILLDFGNNIKRVFQNPYVSQKLNNAVFSVLFVDNTGSAFGMFKDRAELLSFLGILIIVLITIEVIKNIAFSDKLQLLSLTLFSAGALGNVVERISFGHVVDYIKLNFINFPVFNCFDIMICTGIILYCLYLISDFKNNKKVNNG